MINYKSYRSGSAFGDIAHFGDGAATECNGGAVCIHLRDRGVPDLICDRLQDFSRRWIFNGARCAADLQLVADSEARLAAHIHNERVAAHIGHQARYVCLYGWQVGSSVVQLAGCGGHGLPDGLAQQGFTEVLAGHVKSSAACPVGAAAGPDQRSPSSLGLSRSGDRRQYLAGGGANHSRGNVANRLAFTLLHAAHAKTSSNPAVCPAAHVQLLSVTATLPASSTHYSIHTP